MRNKSFPYAGHVEGGDWVVLPCCVLLLFCLRDTLSLGAQRRRLLGG